MQWRYDACPTVNYKYCVARRNDDLEALCVYKVNDDGTVSIADVVAPVASLSAARLLTAAVAYDQLKEGCRSIGFYGHGHGFFEESLRDYATRTALNFPITIRPLVVDDHGLTLMLNPSNWLFAWGDTDTI